MNEIIIRTIFISTFLIIMYLEFAFANLAGMFLGQLMLILGTLFGIWSYNKNAKKEVKKSYDKGKKEGYREGLRDF